MSDITPRFEEGGRKLIAGLREHFTPQTRHQIAQLWKRFGETVGLLPHRTGEHAYGICITFEPDGFDYMAGFEVTSSGDLPAGYTMFELLPQRYAVFTHEGDAARLPETFHAIWTQWLPTSGETPAEAPAFERYSKDFNPRTNSDGTEVWLPLLSRKT